MKIKNVRAWSESEECELSRLAIEGYSLLRAAAKLKRSRKSVQRRAFNLGIEFKTPNVRAPKEERLRV